MRRASFSDARRILFFRSIILRAAMIFGKRYSCNGKNQRQNCNTCRQEGKVSNRTAIANHGAPLYLQFHIIANQSQIPDKQQNQASTAQPTAGNSFSSAQLHKTDQQEEHAKECNQEHT